MHYMSVVVLARTLSFMCTCILMAIKWYKAVRHCWKTMNTWEIQTEPWTGVRQGLWQMRWWWWDPCLAAWRWAPSSHNKHTHTSRASKCGFFPPRAPNYYPSEFRTPYEIFDSVAMYGPQISCLCTVWLKWNPTGEGGKSQSHKSRTHRGHLVRKREVSAAGVAM